MPNDAIKDPPRIVRHPRGEQPLVTLTYNDEVRGHLIEEGPEQSEVRWLNGNLTYVSNKHLRRLEADDRMRGNFKVEGTVTGRLPPKAELVEARRAKGVAVPEVPPTHPANRIKKPPPDRLGLQVAEYCEDDVSLKKFAQLNGVWDDKYLHLPNPGLRRMNVVNRLRARVKKGHEVKWP